MESHSFSTTCAFCTGKKRKIKIDVCTTLLQQRTLLLQQRMSDRALEGAVHHIGWWLEDIDLGQRKGFKAKG
jgi:hypothetical protein